MALKNDVRDAVSAKLDDLEGNIKHLYIDTTGNVTVGVGHHINNRIAMSNIAMYTKKNNRPFNLASLPEKFSEYDNVKKLETGKSASWYEQYTRLIMKEHDIFAQKEKHIMSFYNELKGYYSQRNGFKSNFDDFPSNIQIGLFDMIFNLGLTVLVNTFVMFNDAIKKEDWKLAASQSNRPQVNHKRNSYVRDLFNNAKF